MTALGIYEKAIPKGRWVDVFDSVRSAGFDFLEISIDETPLRRQRLAWGTAHRTRIRRLAENAGVRVGTVSLSAHRTWPLGSASAETRGYATDLLQRAIHLAHDIGARRVQLAGYFTFAEPGHSRARSHFVESLEDALPIAREAGVVLAVENMDGSDLRSARELLEVLGDDRLRGLRVYADVGNFAANGLDACAELAVLLPHLECVQLKDSEPGVFRRVPFGAGTVDFRQLFQFLVAHSYEGDLGVEMWNDTGDPTMADSAREWLMSRGLDDLRSTSSSR